MTMTVIQILIRALATVPKGLVKVKQDFEIRGQVESIETRVLLR